MPKIVGYVGTLPPVQEAKGFPWLATAVVGVFAGTALWLSKRRRQELVPNALPEYLPETLRKIDAGIRKARAGEARLEVPPEVREALKNQPPGRYSYDLGADYMTRSRRTKRRQRVRRFKDRTSRRGANQSASRAAQETDSPQLVVETFGKESGPPGSEYEADEFVALSLYRPDGRPEFLIHADKLEVGDLPSKEERQKALAELKQRRIDAPRLKQEAMERRAQAAEAKMRAQVKKLADRLAIEEASREAKASRDTAKQQEKLRRTIEKQVFAGFAAEIRRARKEAAAEIGARLAEEEAKRAAARPAGEAAAPAPASAPMSGKTSRKQRGAPGSAPAPVSTPQDIQEASRAAARKRAATPASGNYLFVGVRGAYAAAIDENGNTALLLSEPFARAAVPMGSLVKIVAPPVTSPDYGKTFKVSAPKKSEKPSPAQAKIIETLSRPAVEAEEEAEAPEAPAPAPEAKPKTSRKAAPAKAAPAKAKAQKAEAPAKPGPKSKAKPEQAKEQPKPAPAKAKPKAKPEAEAKVAPGLYFYIDEDGGQARVIEGDGSVVMLDLTPFTKARAKINTLVAIKKSTKADVPFIVSAAPVGAGPTQEQSDVAFELLSQKAAPSKKRTAKAVAAKKPQRTSKVVTSTPKRGLLEDEEARETESAGVAEEDEDEEQGSLFESSQKARGSRASREKQKPYGTVGVIPLSATFAKGFFDGLYAAAPEAFSELDDGETVQGVGRVSVVPPADTQKRGAGKVTVTFADQDFKLGVDLLRSVGVIEVGDRLAVSAKMDDGAATGVIAKILRRGHVAPSPSMSAAKAPAAKTQAPQKAPKPATSRAAAPARKAEKAPVSRGPSPEQLRIIQMSPQERVLRTRVKPDAVRRVIDFQIPQRMQFEPKGTTLADIGVAKYPGSGNDGEFSFTGTVSGVPTGPEAAAGMGSVEITFLFGKIPVPVGSFSSRDISLGDLVTIQGQILGRDLPTLQLQHIPQKTITPKKGESVSKKPTSKAKKAGATSRSVKKNSRASDQDPSLFKEFRRVINMSSAEITRWRQNPQHRDASLPHIRAELPLLAQMKRTPMSKWTPRMWNKAMRAVNFVKRHEAQMKVQAKRYGTGRFHATYKRIIGLLNWGRKTPGVNIRGVLASKGRKTSKRLRSNGRVMTWERFAAGMVVFAKSTGRMLLLRRSGPSSDPGTWGIPGGFCRQDMADEPLLDCAKREFAEETQSPYEPMGPTSPFFIARTPSVTYSTFIGYVPDEFEPELDEEHDAYGWFSLGALPSPLHRGVQTLLSYTHADLLRMAPKR